MTETVPKEDLEALVEEWRDHGLHPADGGREMDKCADELAELIDE